IGGVGAGTAGASAAGSTSSTGSMNASVQKDYDTFLTLLTTQLQNQDPLSPLDTNQFTQQLVEFSQVEQQMNTNNYLSNLLTLQGSNDLIEAQGLVGKTVNLNDANAALENGQASYSYTLPSTAASTTLAISNAQGQVLWTGTGSTSSGAHAFTWNGEDSSGKTQPDGVYTLSVAATAADGTTLTAPITTSGAVDSVSNVNGTTTLTVGTAKYPLSELLGMQSQSS
ncbi:MAG: flagellar hook assembly protein FlgD, partial [Alphaproteobacteria bacterium]|nr:flagellar hook assembly protein FlgD [Alphaproteobacteria bacterium]